MIIIEKLILFLNQNIKFFIAFLFSFFLLGSEVVAQSQIISSLNNTENQELAAFISFDGKKIIYVSYLDNIPKFYEADINEMGEWVNQTLLDDINNYKTDAYLGTPVYNHNASRIYFEADYNIDSSGMDIFYSDRTLTGWTAPQSMGIPINSMAYDGEPSISIDELSLYFVRQDIETSDVDSKCKKIMVSAKGIDGKWQEPTYLPEPINLVCERSPRILSDNKTLLFSSVREGGKGGYDLYFAKQLTKNVWLLPVPLDTINTELNELYPSTSFWGNDLIFSLVDESKKKIKGNVYYHPIPSEFKPDKSLYIFGKITDLYSDEPVTSIITVYNPNTSVKIFNVENNINDGAYSLFLPLGKEFLIDYSGINYSHVFQNFYTNELQNNTVTESNVKLYNEVHLLLNVFDKEIFQPQDAKITVKDGILNRTEIADVETIDVGRFDIALPIGKKYIIEIQKTYFETFFLEFDLTGVIQFDEFERDIELSSRKQKIEFSIIDAESKEGLLVDIEIINLNTNEKYTVVATTDAKGKAYIELREGDKYEINMSPKGYAFYNTTLDLEAEDFNTSIKVELTPLTTQTMFELQNITFETNSASLNASSNEELLRVTRLMENNPEIIIEISAHTDDVGSELYNQKLSEKRAQSVVDFLIENGINLERLIAKGYGETIPISPNDNDENKAKNRRVELKIIEI